MLEFISRERGRCGVLWTPRTMNSGHMIKRVCVHVCTNVSLECDFVLLNLLTLVLGILQRHCARGEGSSPDCSMQRPVH